MRVLYVITMLLVTGCVTPTYVLKSKTVETTWTNKDGRTIKSTEKEEVLQVIDADERLTPEVIKFRQPLIHLSWWDHAGL